MAQVHQIHFVTKLLLHYYAIGKNYLNATFFNLNFFFCLFLKQRTHKSKDNLYQICFKAIRETTKYLGIFYVRHRTTVQPHDHVSNFIKMQRYQPPLWSLKNNCFQIVWTFFKFNLFYLREFVYALSVQYVSFLSANSVLGVRYLSI